MDLQLVSFKLCPYVQRSVITLKHKGVDFDVTYIDLENRPDWFMKISPFGKVPVLRVKDGDREETIFESAVINEFVDEVTDGSMMPSDPIQKALNRAWIEFASACFMDIYMLVRAPDQATFDEHVAGLRDKLGKMQDQLGEGPYWNGNELNLIDTSIAPMFMRLKGLEEFGVEVLKDFPKLAAYGERLLALPEVKDSVVPEFWDLNREYLQKNGGLLVA